MTGASTRQHPAPYPIELAERLVRMFSFVGDTVLDPFMGTGTTNIAAARWGRNSIGVEVDPEYFDTGCQPDRGRHAKAAHDARHLSAPCRIAMLDVQKELAKAVKHFWKTRANQKTKQGGGSG